MRNGEPMSKKNLFLVLTLSAMSLTLSACGPKGGADETDNYNAPSRKAEFVSATKYFGPLVVKEGDTEVDTGSRPWSAYYLPLKSTYLFQGEQRGQAPLEKYDAWVMRLNGGNDLGTAAYERDHFYRDDAENWVGLCHAWAVASILEPAPIHSVEMNGVKFSVGDVKALIVKSYEIKDHELNFGQRIDDSGESVGGFDPDQFHTVLQNQLYLKHKPFVLNKSPGTEVWNVPVWAAASHIRADSGNAHVFHVDTEIDITMPVTQPSPASLEDTRPIHEVITYTYDLKGRRMRDGSLQVFESEWTGDSRKFHPNFATILDQVKSHHSRNLKIDNQLVLTLTQKAATDGANTSGW